jgi:5-methylthioadenosine/S-adenosylhomocysteine deaminase
MDNSNFLTRHPHFPDQGKRTFIKKALALGLLGMGGVGSLSAFGLKDKSNERTLPDQGHYLIKNAHIISMDGSQSEISKGDIHVREGQIISIGKNLEATGAEIIEGEGMLAMPGLVDTHWHMWTNLMRSMAGDREGKGYFDITRMFGRHFTPDDMYQATRLATLEAIYSGITTVHDWSHNVRSLQHAEGSLRALRESGIRARYSCGAASGQDGKEPMDFEILSRLQNNWKQYDPEGLLQLGFAWRGMGDHPGIDSDAGVGKNELDQARKMGLPVTVHASSPKILKGLAEAGVLGRDMQVVHGMGADFPEIKEMVSAGASISISPFSELRIGYGFPPINKFVQSGATIGLSIDTTTLSGNADMFAVMKVFLNTANALARNEFELTADQVLEMGTLGGAKSLGLDGSIGSLEAGKQADLILINTRVPNIGVITNPIDLIVEAAQPFNVDLVMVAGRVLKRNGKLADPKAEEIYSTATAAFQRLKQKVI